MKKKMTRLSALLLTLVLTLTLLAVPAMAADEETYWGNPSFVLMITNGENTMATSAFRVWDPESCGMFLLAPAAIANAVKNGYELYLIGEDGYFEQAQLLGASGNLSCLSAPGMDEAAYYYALSAEPLQADDSFIVVWAELGKDDNENYQAEEKRDGFTLNDWEAQKDGSYLSKEEHESFYTIGALVFSQATASAIGYYDIGENDEIILVPIEAGLPEEYALEFYTPDADPESDPEPEAEPESEPETEPEPEPEPVSEPDPEPESKPTPTTTSASASAATSEPAPEPASEPVQQTTQGEDRDDNSVILWLVGIAAAAGLGYLIWRVNTKKKPSQPVEKPNEGTVMLEEDFQFPPQMQTPPQMPARFAVRDRTGHVAISGTSGQLHFGRASACDIRLPAEDTSVSARHCTLSRQNGELYLTDDGSTNGTFFSENERLKPHTPYRIRKGMAFFLSDPSHTYVVTEDEI